MILLKSSDPEDDSSTASQSGPRLKMRPALSMRESTDEEKLANEEHRSRDSRG